VSDLGDFKLKLGILTDNNSFNKALSSIDSISSSVSHLVGVVRSAAAVLAVEAFGNVETAQLKTATALGISTVELEKWNAACTITNTKSASLISDMNSVDKKMQEFKKNGTIDAEFQRNLGLLDLNMGIDAFAKLNADERLEFVLRKAQSLKGTKSIKDIATIVGDLMGSSASEMFMMMNQMGISVDDMLDRASSMVFTDDSTKTKAAGMISELHQLEFVGSQLGKLFASEISPGVSEFLKMLSDFAKDESVVSFVKDLGSGINELISGAAKMTKTTVESTASYFDAIITGYKSIAYYMMGDTKNGNAFMESFSTKMKNFSNKVIDSIAGEGTSKKIDEALDKDLKRREDLKKINDSITGAGVTSYKQITGQAKVWVDSYINKYGSDGLKLEDLPSQEINDGIVKPSGQVVSVAQDDWIFAVKDITRLASAFIPRNYAQAAGGEVSIVQNFTISGSNDIPSVLRQQAYKGTREALLATMQSSALRMQNMPGMI